MKTRLTLLTYDIIGPNGRLQWNPNESDIGLHELEPICWNKKYEKHNDVLLELITMEGILEDAYPSLKLSNERKQELEQECEQLYESIKWLGLEHRPPGHFKIFNEHEYVMSVYIVLHYFRCHDTLDCCIHGIHDVPKYVVPELAKYERGEPYSKRLLL